MRTVDPELREIYSAAGRLGARVRDIGTTLEQRRSHTAPAREKRAANRLERLKAQVDPDGILTDEEREHQAQLLLEAAVHKRRLDELRRERKQRLIDDALDLVTADAS